MARQLSPIALGNSSLRKYRHVGAFFGSPDDEYRVMTPFIRDGLLRGERTVHFVAGGADDHLDRLRRGGLDVDDARTRGQLAIFQSESMYTPDGAFDGRRMLDTLERLLDEAPALGFGLTRLWAHAEFVSSAGASAHELIEYETRLNYMLPRSSDAVVCVYDLAKTSSAVAFDAIRTHPVVIVGDVLLENPYFVPPDLFLTELAERIGGRPSPPPAALDGT